MNMRAVLVVVGVAVTPVFLYTIWPTPPAAVRPPQPAFAVVDEVSPANVDSQPASAEPQSVAEMPQSAAIEMQAASPPAVEPAPEFADFSLADFSELAKADISYDSYEPARTAARTVGPVLQSARPIEPGSVDMSLRNSDYPNTYISAIEIDLASPNHWIRLTWTGPQADSQETGPFRSSPGAGLGSNDCNDRTESRRDGSNCTPKGSFTVEGFNEHLPSYVHCKHVTWFHAVRGVAIHSYSQVANYPASHGCVRVEPHTAQLIHNNAKIGDTAVTVGGTWSRR